MLLRWGENMTKKKAQIFISWSHTNSKAFANHLKNIMENEIFKGSDLSCFVSDTDIASGEDWWIKIKKELKRSKMGIVCITKENVNAPWLYYEAGAMIANGYKVVPLTIGCDLNLIKETPLFGNQVRAFYDERQFIQMMIDINKEFKLITTDDGNPVSDKQLKLIVKDGYSKLK